MKSIYLFFLLLLPVLAISQNTDSQLSPSQLEVNEEEIFKKVDISPYFPGCEEKAALNERKKCADEKMLQFIYYNIKYPAEAVAQKVEGMVVIKFVIEKDGTITNAEIAREIGAGCGQAALDVINSMPRWNPGMNEGKPVRTYFNIPVKFKLD